MRISERLQEAIPLMIQRISPRHCGRKLSKCFLKWHEKSAGALRLLGFGASGLQETGSGPNQLFPEPDQEKQKRIDEAFDKIRYKFGYDALRRGK